MSIAHKGSAMKEKVGTLMTVNGIHPAAIGSTETITTVEQAAQWLHQKMSTRANYDAVGKAGHAGAGIVVGGVGGIVGAIAGPVGAGVGGAAGAALGMGGAWALGKVGRAGKYIYKSVAGTQGEHRRQAARVIVRGALDYKMGISESPLAYQLMQLFYDSPEPLDTAILIRSEQDEEGIAAAVAERFKS